MRVALWTSSLLLVWFMASSNLRANPVQQPVRHTERLVAIMETASEKPVKERQELAREVRGYFDFDKLIREAIKPQRAAFTNQQMARYEQLFGELLDTVPFLQPTLSQTAEFTMGAPQRRDGTVNIPVDTYLPQDDIQTSIGFVWEQLNGAWKVVDVEMDGASLLLDYRNQFSRIVAKDGASGLLQRLEKKLDELRASAAEGG